jgi:hypothetical protein
VRPGRPGRFSPTTQRRFGGFVATGGVLALNLNELPVHLVKCAQKLQALEALPFVRDRAGSGACPSPGVVSQHQADGAEDPTRDIEKADGVRRPGRCVCCHP